MSICSCGIRVEPQKTPKNEPPSQCLGRPGGQPIKFAGISRGSEITAGPGKPFVTEGVQLNSGAKKISTEEVMKKTLLIAVGMVALGSASVVSAADGGFFDLLGDRIDARLDRRGEAINDRLDRRGERINARLDALSQRAEDKGKLRLAERLDRRGDRIENRLDWRGNRIEWRKDIRGDRINRRLDRLGEIRYRRHHRGN